MPLEKDKDVRACLKQGEVYTMGWDASTSPMTVMGNSSFYVRQGNCPGGAISFEMVDKPGYFVRHRDGKLHVDSNDGSRLFHLDSSFMAPPGLSSNSPATTSLRPVNYPYDFVLRQGQVVTMGNFKESSQYAVDATWTPVAAPGGVGLLI